MSKRISLRKSKEFPGKWEVVIPGQKTRVFQMKSNAREVYEAAIRVKAKRRQRAKRR